MTQLDIVKQNTQKLLSILNESKNEDGISNISEKEVIEKLGLSKQWLKTHLERINIIEKMIDNRNSYFITKCNRFSEIPTYQKIYLLLIHAIKENIFELLKESEICERYKLPLQVVKMAKAYWKNYQENIDIITYIYQSDLSDEELTKKLMGSELNT